MHCWGFAFALLATAQLIHGTPAQDQLAHNELSGFAANQQRQYPWPGPDRGFRMEIDNLLDLVVSEQQIKTQQVRCV